MMTTGEPYQEKGVDYFRKQDRGRVERQMVFHSQRQLARRRSFRLVRREFSEEIYTLLGQSLRLN